VVAEHAVAAEAGRRQRIQQCAHIFQPVVEMHKVAGMNQQIIFEVGGEPPQPVDLRPFTPGATLKMGVGQMQDAQPARRQARRGVGQAHGQVFQLNVQRLHQQRVAQGGSTRAHGQAAQRQPCTPASVWLRRRVGSFIG